MKKNTLFLAQAAMIAAVYVVLTVAFAPISYGEIQVRISEALTILPVFTPAAVPGLFVGCLLANIIGGAVLPDIIFGSLATLIGAVGTYLLFGPKDGTAPGSAPHMNGFRKYLAPLPPIVANTVIVPFVLRYAYGIALPIPFMMLTVGVGEVISCGILGLLLFFILNPRRELFLLDQTA